MTGDAAPLTPADTDRPSLFARKGRAEPVAAARTSAIHLVVSDTSTGGSGGIEADTSDGESPIDRHTLGPVTDDGDEERASAMAAAASLDAPPFDPSRARPVTFDAVPQTSTDAAAVLPAVAATRLRPATVVLAGAAALAAVAAFFAVTSWYDYTMAPPVASPAETVVAIPVAPVAPPEPPAPAMQQPVIDLVRLEPGGATIIAGRGLPGSALIVLDNDVAIGTVVVGETGDWMLTPDHTLAGGDHEISLAIKADADVVSVATPAAVAATPTPRPALSGPVGPARYVVQIASVRSAAGADQEWNKLRTALPDLLGGLTPTIDTAELRDRGTFHRIRLGPFDDRDTAHALCTALNDAGRDCLVVRR